jgi:hypothetical protein
MAEGVMRQPQRPERRLLAKGRSSRGAVRKPCLSNARFGSLEVDAGALPFAADRGRAAVIVNEAEQEDLSVTIPF